MPLPFSLRSKPAIRRTRRSDAFAAGVTALLVFGCSGHDNGSITVTITHEHIEGGVTKDAGATGPVCKGPGYPDTALGVSFSHLSATVVDASGTPVPMLIAQTCGINLCLNGSTNGNGFVSFDQTVSLDKPAFKYGDGANYARFALPLMGDPVDVDLGNEVTVAFGPAASGASLDPGTTATSAGVSLVLAPNLSPAMPDPFDFPTPDLKKFRAARVPLDAAPSAVDPAFGLEILDALTPEGTVLCPAAKMQVANDVGWPAGARVEFFLHGVDVAEEWAPYGGWAKVSEGSVSTDGKVIATDDGGGIPELSVVGIRRVKD